MAKTEIQASVGLDTTKFQRGLAKADKGVTKFAKNAIRSFGAIAGAAGLSALANSAIRLGSEITNLAKLSGTGTTEFQEFAFAARSMGIENEKLADILKDVSDKVGDFLQTGGGPLADFFENIAPKVGVTAQQFRNLSGKDALQLYVSSLEKANLSQSEMTFFMEAIASDATLLLPLLAKNGEELNKFAKEAHELGLVLEKDTLDKLKAASIEMFKFNNILTIMTGKVLVNVIPAFQMFFGGLGATSDMFAMLTGKAMSFFGFLSRSVGIVMQPAIKSFAALSRGAEAAGLAMSGNVNDARKAAKESVDLAKGAFETLKDVPEEIGKNWKRATEEMELDSAAFEKSTKERAGKMKKAWADLKGEKAKATEDSGGGGGGAATGKLDSLQATKPGAGKAGKAGTAMGYNIERGEFEARGDFIDRRNKSIQALNELRDKLAQQDVTGRSAGITDQLVLAAQGGGTSANPAVATEEAAKSSAESLKAIETELTRTS